MTITHAGAEAFAPNLERLAKDAQAVGMAVRGGFHPLPEDGVPSFADGEPARTVVLFGCIGGAQWPAFASSPEYADGRADPLDRWSHRIIDAIGARYGAMGLYPSMGPPWLPFQRWAMRAEPVHVSPIHLLIHPDFGLWHAYRGALGFRARIEVPPLIRRASPCEACAQKPCLNTCPVGAMGPGVYDRSRCTAHVASDSGRDCFSSSCRARRSCPVGGSYRYGGAQSEFHMSAFLEQSSARSLGR